MEKCVAKWYIHVDKCEINAMMIAIIGDRISTDESCTCAYDYFYWSNGCCKSNTSFWQQYGERYGEDDEICCILDLQRREISFEKNGESQGIANTNIEVRENFKYRCGVSLYSQTEQCSIMRFEKDH